jgi:hypothetical protein
MGQIESGEYLEPPTAGKPGRAFIHRRKYRGCTGNIDPNNSNIVYADMWAARQGPWENGRWAGTQSGLFKSTDGGDTWKKLLRGYHLPGKVLAGLVFVLLPQIPVVYMQLLMQVIWAVFTEAMMQANHGCALIRMKDTGTRG